MKIKSVKILGNNFRSLAADKLYEFNTSFREDRLSTKIFAGLNGSGKSNFLELFSEIFYFLEIYHLDTAGEEEKKNRFFGFEIEYYLPFQFYPLQNSIFDEITPGRDYTDAATRMGLPVFESEAYNAYLDRQHNAYLEDVRNTSENYIDNRNIRVKIAKQLDGYMQFSIYNNRTSQYTVIVKNTQDLLPSRVIAYTSGQNELLSNPYYKLKYHYFKAFEKRIGDNENISENHRLFFLDYNSNFSIFLANMLLGDVHKRKIITSILQIKELSSFRITLNTDELYQRVIPLNKGIAKNIEKLKLCATTWVEKKVNKHNLLILDFFVTSATKQVFAYHFKSTFNLFKAFYELDIFNLYLVNQTTRKLILNAHKSFNITDEMPKPDPSRLVFRIEKIVINKILESEDNVQNIFYKALSDGEHQFNEVVGTVMMMDLEGSLFLMDEPDTHFNPKWRAEFLKTLNIAAAKSFDEHDRIVSVRNQELIMTTHSPFVISDSDSQDVYKFVKKDGIVDYSNPEFQVYGSSVSIILDEIFEKSEGISEMAKKELKEMVDNIKTIDDLRDVVERLNRDFGDSVEKFDLFSKLRNIKEELERGT